MTVHRKDTKKTAKSKIILPSRRYTTVLPKKRKNTKIINKSDKTKTNFYNKMQIIPRLASLKIKNISTNQHKVHTLLV